MKVAPSLNLSRGLAKERRSEVEPIWQHVISYNRTLHVKVLEMEAEAEVKALLLDDRQPSVDTVPKSAGCSTAADMSRLQSRYGVGTASAGTTLSTEAMGFSNAPPTSGALRLRNVVDENVMIATVSHPHVMARTVGINHEEAFLEKYRRFTEEENVAVEGAAGRVRQEKVKLGKLDEKYANADYIKMILESPPVNNGDDAIVAEA
uniref:Uncharacterized protein TCIL3000_8_1380 n=1 Tax=Trypanosoma congolense (strain IL3000) TaxID=1068625 RepID=G0URA8_TRYCI|nr:unnamed protein product [Trypanosoma congolense IL3000]